MRVLVVDDDQSSCEMLAKILKRTGADVEWTTDSPAGFAQSLQFPYDLVVLDVQMPELLGTDFATALKRQRPEVPIILISAFADKALQKTAAHFGVVLLSKPFTPSALLAATSNFLSPIA